MQKQGCVFLLFFKVWKFSEMRCCTASFAACNGYKIVKKRLTPAKSCAIIKINRGRGQHPFAKPLAESARLVRGRSGADG